MDAAARRRVRERLRARRSGADRPKGPTAAELEAEKAQRVLGLKRLLLDKVAGKERHVGRGLKRVLSQFDADRSGELEMPEFTRALEHYLNGIHEDDVRALAEDFDRDGSGSISIEEFIAAFSELQNEAPSTPAPAPPMLRRSAARTAPAPGPRTATSPQQDPDALGLFRPSPPAARAPPPIAPAAPAPPRAPAARAPPRAPSEAGSYRPLNAVADSAEQRLERFGSAARLLLLQRVSADDRQRVRGSRAGALAAGDRLSLHRNAHMKELFRREVRRIFSRSSGGAVTMSDSLPIDAFAAAMGQMTPSGQKSCLDTGAGDVELLWEMSDGSAGGFAEVLLRLPEASAATADGPFPRDPLASRNVAEDQRIRYRFCRTPVYPPSGWDVRAGVRRSQRRPSAQLGLRHAFGYRSDRQGQNLFATADGLLVTTVAGCGIVQDAESGAQRFFRGHDDDISCLDVTVDAKDPRTVVSDVLLDKFAQRTRGALRGQRFHLCATGQMGADPYCCVWLAQRPPPGGGGECVELCRFGARPDLMRMVCAVAFAPSARIVVAIGCDEKHTACLYGLACGDGVALLAQVPTANGEPPQIHDVAFNHSPSGGAAEEFVTCGKRHLKFWTVRREGAAPLRVAGRPARYGGAASAPRAVLRAVYLRSGGGELALCAGDNGTLYVFRNGRCARALQACEGPCQAIAEHGDALFAAGGDGKVRRFALPSFAAGAPLPLPPSHSVGEAPREASMAPDGSTSSSDSAQFQAFCRRRQQEAREERQARIDRRLEDGGDSVAMRERLRRLRMREGVQRAKPFPVVTDLAVLRGGRAGAEILALGTSRGAVLALQGGGRSKVLSSAHFGSVQALAMHPKAPGVFATAAEDRRLVVWSADARAMVNARKLPLPARSADFHPGGRFLAVGFRWGSFAVFGYDAQAPMGRGMPGLLAKRHCQEDIDDLKYSPDGRFLAVASHDQYIDVYAAAGGYERVHRFRGHSSYVSHVDWSADSRLLQSNCGAYEILYWDVATGRQVRSTRDSVEADTDWHTFTCVLGFPCMGIWQPESDGTDVNALMRSRDGGHIVTGDDAGMVRLYNAPVVVQHAPHHAYAAHSAHVMNVRFNRDEDLVVSVGGNDKAVFLWAVVKA